MYAFKMQSCLQAKCNCIAHGRLFCLLLLGMKIVILILSAIFILFWLYAIYAKVADFAAFKREMLSQVFPQTVAHGLSYILLVVWISIAVLLASDIDKLYGMLLNFVMLLSFSIYVGLAKFEFFTSTPCSCAGLFHFNWKEQFYFNLMVTAVAAAGLILTCKDRERRKLVWTR